jgi:pyruvate carboxylase subunit B
LTKNTTEKPLQVGDKIEVGDLIGYIEAMKTMNSIRPIKLEMLLR